MPARRNYVYVFDIDSGDRAALDDAPRVRACLADIVASAGLTPVADVEHRFSPQGLSAAILLAESHIAVHTWPEAGAAYVTLTTCRPPAAPDFADAAAGLLREAFGARHVDVRTVS